MFILESTISAIYILYHFGFEIGVGSGGLGTMPPRGSIGKKVLKAEAEGVVRTAKVKVAENLETAIKQKRQNINEIRQKAKEQEARIRQATENKIKVLNEQTQKEVQEELKKLQELTQKKLNVQTQLQD